MSFIQMTKALMPGLVYVCGVAFGMEKLTRTTSFNMFIIAIGVAIAAYGEINFIYIGVVEQLSALVFEALRLMLVQVLITRQGRDEPYPVPVLRVTRVRRVSGAPVHRG